MKTQLAWQDYPADKDGVSSVCYSVCFSPDGGQLVAAVGARVLVYSSAEGELLHTLQGHKDAVYCVAYAADGKCFASGGADKTVNIWTSQGEGILRYGHADSIQALAYNPATHTLASVTASGLGLWSQEQQNVAKFKLASKALCCQWDSEGTLLAIGCQDGTVSLRGRDGAQRMLIAAGQAAVHSLAWHPEDPGVLVVGLLDGLLRFFDTANGQQRHKERRLQPHTPPAAAAPDTGAGNATGGGAAAGAAPDRLGRGRSFGLAKAASFGGDGGSGAAAGGAGARQDTAAARDGGATATTSSGGPGPHAWVDPLALAVLGGRYLLVAGTDSCVQLLSDEGVYLSTVALRRAWAWAVAAHPRHSWVAVGGQDGGVALVHVTMLTVHGLHGERYAYRDGLTDVVVQHMATEQSIRIKCRDHVRKVAVYRDKVAVQLPHKVVIYQLAAAGGGDESEADAACSSSMHYVCARQIHQQLPCSLLVVAARHIVLCQQRRLQLLGLDGALEREWALDAVVRYIKVAGGPPGREALLVGLKAGGVAQVLLDNPFAIPLVEHAAAVRCLDVNADRSQLALVDEAGKLVVFDLASKAVVYEALGVNCVAWNGDCNDMLAFSGGGQLSVRVASLAPAAQKMSGFVVGFKGSKAFCLQAGTMQVVDVPQGAPLARLLATGDLGGAHEVACLGVGDAEWRALALAALQALDLAVARKAWARLLDPRALLLVDQLEASAAAGEPQAALLAQVAAWRGDFAAAAHLFEQAGQRARAVEMFTDLCMGEEARLWAEGRGGGQAAAGVPAAGTRGGEPQQEAPEVEAAACSGEGGASQWAAAREALLRLEDWEGLAALYVEAEAWDEALQLAGARPGLAPAVQLPYGRWLVGAGRYDEARAAFRAGGRPQEAAALLGLLAAAAAEQRRWADAGQLHYQLATEALRDVVGAGGCMGEADLAALERFAALYDAAELYAAFDLVAAAAWQPFASCDEGTLFNAACFLASRCLSRPGGPPPGISLAAVMWVLAGRAARAGAFKTARLAHGKLAALVLPPAWQAEAEAAALALRARPMSDAEAALPVCYRCHAGNPLVNLQGDACVACGAAFLRSPLTWEVLPAVEFVLEAGVGPAEALAAVGTAVAAPLGGHADGDGGAGGMAGREAKAGGADMLLLDAPDEGGSDAGGRGGSSFDEQAAVPHASIVLGLADLAAMRPGEVLVRRWAAAPGLPCQWFRAVDAGERPLLVGGCGHLYEADEHDMYMLEHGRAPFSGEPAGSSPVQAAVAGSAAAGAQQRWQPAKPAPPAAAAVPRPLKRVAG